jgi:hypothetical protein
MKVGRRLGRRGKHIQLVSQPIRLFPICTVSPPAHSAMGSCRSPALLTCSVNACQNHIDELRIEQHDSCRITGIGVSLRFSHVPVVFDTKHHFWSQDEESIHVARETVGLLSNTRVLTAINSRLRRAPSCRLALEIPQNHERPASPSLPLAAPQSVGLSVCCCASRIADLPLRTPS